MTCTAAIVLAAAAAPGCLMVPKSTTTTRVVEQGTAQSSGPTGPLVFEAVAQDATVRLGARNLKTCRREAFSIVETKRDKELSVGILDVKDGRGALMALFLAPVTLAVSGVISGIIVHSHDATTTRDRSVTKVDTYACPVPARIPMTLALASGATVDVTTNADGTYAFAIPAGEVDHGVLTVTAAGRVAAVPYFRDRTACAAERADLFTRANAVSTAADRAYLLAALPRCPLMTTGGVDHRERVWDLTLRASIAAARGQCGEAMQLRAKLGAFDGAQANALVQQPDIAWCMRNAEIAMTARRPAAHASGSDRCLSTRGAALREAQTIADVQERGRVLSRIPQCR